MLDRSGWIAIAVAVLGGNLLLQQQHALPPTWVSALVAVLALFCLASRRWRLLGWFVLAGALAAWHGERGMQARLPVAMEGIDLPVSGQLVGLAASTADGTGFLFRIDDDHGHGFAPAIVRLTWYGRTVPPACSRWQFTVRLKRPRSAVNPGSADAERAALVRGMAASGYVRDGPRQPRWLTTPLCLDGVRQAIAQSIDERLGDPYSARLIKALAVGDTRGLDSDDWRVARITGVAHLISISGLHMGMAALFGVGLARLLWWLWPAWGLRIPRPLAMAVGALVMATPYCLLAGAALPTVRSLLMVAVVALAKTQRRALATPQVLSLVLVVVLILDPLASLAPGFWLSFVAVAMLVGMLAVEGRGLRGFATQLLRTQRLMTVGLLPLTLAFFGQASVVGALANLMAAPLVSLIVVPMTLVGALLLHPVPWLASPVLRLASTLLEAQWGWLETMADWPGAQWATAAPGPLATALALAGAVWLLAPRGWPLRWLGLACMLPLVSAGIRSPGPGALRLWVLDVGQGLAVVVQTHRRTLVYDAGPRFRSGGDLGASQVVPALHALGTRRLDAIIVSHGDNDHAGGVPSVLAAFPGARVFGDENPHRGLAMEPCGRRRWQWDDVVFSTFPADARAKGNDRSCVLLIEHAQGRILIPGDASIRAEAAIVEQVGAGTPLTLVVGHHGSRTSTSRAMLAALRPQLALVSAGWRSRFGHPHPDVLARLHDAGALVMNTATDGAIQVDMSRAPTPVAWRAERPAYWRER